MPVNAVTHPAATHTTTHAVAHPAAHPATPGIPPVAAGQHLVTQSGHAVHSSPPAHPALTPSPAQAQVGRAVVSRTNSELHPLLQQIIAGQAQRATQIQATAEHRNIVARQAWRDDVIRRLQRVENDVMPHPTRGVNRTLRY